MVFHGKWYDEVRVGDEFGTALTVTETHIVLGSGLFGDFNPLHVNEEFSKKSAFGGRVLHGPFTSALVAAPVGNYFAGTAIAYLEHTCRFKTPVRAGDTLATRWTVTAKSDKPKHKGGIIEMKCVCTNQRGELAVEGEGRILVTNRS
jgi:3-hydroxybutyryl-CoA dehydratase